MSRIRLPRIARFIALPCGLLACELLACEAGAPGEDAASEPIAVDRAPIRGGEVELGEDAVGMLEFETGRFGTGTLIAPNVVITAAHVVGGSIKGFYVGTGVPVDSYMGTESSDTMVKHEITEKIIHPSYKTGGTHRDWPGMDLDIGLVRLATPIVDIAPRKLALSPPALDTVCKSVGFGRHEHPDDPTSPDIFLVKQKRSALARVDKVFDELLRATWETGIADSGDSGGPFFCDDRIVATTCCHSDGDWPVHDTELYTRVDITHAWIESMVIEWGNPPFEPDCGGASGVGGGCGGGGGSGGSEDGGQPAQGGASNGGAGGAEVDDGEVEPSGGCSTTGIAPFGGAAGALLALGLAAARRRRRS